MPTKYWNRGDDADTVMLIIVLTNTKDRMNPILEGRKIPQVTFRTRVATDWKNVTSDDIFKGKTVVVFSLPGAFTPTCSSTHLPRYNELAPALDRKSVV